jgi:hypothetical protein
VNNWLDQGCGAVVEGLTFSAKHWEMVPWKVIFFPFHLQCALWQRIRQKHKGGICRLYVVIFLQFQNVLLWKVWNYTQLRY